MWKEQKMGVALFVAILLSYVYYQKYKEPVENFDSKYVRVFFTVFVLTYLAFYFADTETSTAQMRGAMYMGEPNF